MEVANQSTHATSICVMTSLFEGALALLSAKRWADATNANFACSVSGEDAETGNKNDNLVR